MITTTTSSTANANAYTIFLQKQLFHIDHSEFVCGWGAAFINITVTYPIYKIIFRQVCVFKVQTHKSKYISFHIV